MPDITASELTLEEKASLTSGASFWYTKPIERVGLPSIMLTDGPHGLRKQTASADHRAMTASITATTTASATAATARVTVSANKVCRRTKAMAATISAMRPRIRSARCRPFRKAARNIRSPI